MPGRDLRTRYAQIGDPELLLPADWADEIGTELGRLAREAPELPATWDERCARARQGADLLRRRHEGLWATADDRTRPVLLRRAVLGHAPGGLSSGAWLQWCSDPGNADEALTMQLLANYAADVGVGRPRASRGDAYLALLRHLSRAEHAVPTGRLASDPGVPDDAFYLPVILLVMGRLPDRFRPELIGADLYLRSAGLPPALAGVRRLLPTAVDWTVIDTAASLPVAREAVDLLAGADRAGAARAATGFAWACAAAERFSAALLATLEAARDPGYEMAELLRGRAREGLVYHRSFLLEGRSLSDWLAQARTDPGPLLAALARSRLVKPGRSDASPLVNGLVSERGPMFRVFSPADLDVVRRWIDALPAQPPPAVPASPVSPATLATPAVTAAPAAPAVRLSGPAPRNARPPGRVSLDLREAYHALVRRVDTPRVRRFAEEYVAGWLARAEHGIDRAPNIPPERLGPEGLRPWLQEQHDRHAAEFDSGGGVPSREDLIDSTVQLAPLTLIDGAWLAGFTDYDLASSEHGHFLFETYWDELGNGELKLNHPLIYREVLGQMGVRLPPTGSVEFARSPLLRDESFALPVYWLSVGRLPRTRMPEILGLNVAMELSGVGGGYRRARIALKKYGFSTRFVDIHNTIDNVATGHSAWAADAVDTYLGAVAATHGMPAREAAWRRIRAGYRSLSPPSDYRARRAQRRARRAHARRADA